MSWQPPSDPPPSSQQQWPAQPQPQWGTPAPGSGGSNGKAVAALVLGICGLVVCPLVCSVLAIVFGKQAQQEIAVNPAQSGDGMARAGVIMGIIGLALYGVILLIYIAVIVAAAGSA
jgi:hypothetical protein